MIFVDKSFPCASACSFPCQAFRWSSYTLWRWLSVAFISAKGFPHSGQKNSPWAYWTISLFVALFKDSPPPVKNWKKLQKVVWVNYSFSCSFPSLMSSRTRGPPFAPPLRPASDTVILPFSISSLFCLLDKNIHLVLELNLGHNGLARLNCS